MRNLLFLGLFLFQFWGSAQNIAISKDLVEVGNRVESLHQALIDPDTNTLIELTSKDLSYGHSNGVIQNQSSFIEKLVNGESDFISIENQNQTIEVIGNVAMVRHNLAAHIKDGGIEKDIKIGVLLVWQKQKKKWLLIARQAFKLPT